jgi:hypothetical protein
MREAVQNASAINKRTVYLLFMKHHLARGSVADPISDPCTRQTAMDFLVHDEPRTEMAAGSRSHLDTNTFSYACCRIPGKAECLGKQRHRSQVLHRALARCLERRKGYAAPDRGSESTLG